MKKAAPWRGRLRWSTYNAVRTSFQLLETNRWRSAPCRQVMGGGTGSGRESAGAVG
jgi:hypothetical protein